MLISLCIKNFAIVSTLELDFSNGLTAFTGETGAGKSIMIDALMLALGERADVSVIRQGASSCDITACFAIDPMSAPSHWLAEQGLASEEGMVILRRVISLEGRSKSYINGQLFPLQKIKELSEIVVDIHGQHQHLTLLQHKTHREQLDQYAGHDALLEAVEKHYYHCQSLEDALVTLEKETATSDEIGLLEQALSELSQLAPLEGEMEALHKEHQLLHHAQDYLEHLRHIEHHLNGEEYPNVCRQLHQIIHHLQALPGEQASIENATTLINTALIHCEETLNEIMRFSTQIHLEPERLQEVEARMSALHQMARKYQVEPNHLLRHQQALTSSLQALQDQDSRRAQLLEQYHVAVAAYQEAALALRASRQAEAPRLAESITACMQTLGMPKGYILIEITSVEARQPHGLDKVEYKVCANPGMAPDVLSKVASGGELSRIGLAIHMITAQRATTTTLLFDEVDVGIGGATAALVGQSLRALGERLQVFCVTHQPQVASCAHHHFRVEKKSDQAQTVTSVTRLSESQQIDELARMLGGRSITEQTRAHARELLTESQGCA